ncbi:MAG: agmatinase [Planctomycetales bacterium]|nr:agmatinase [Planctomycetales bacterium]
MTPASWNFLDLPSRLTGLEKAKVVILPIPYERTVTFLKGTGTGPAAIINASSQVELYDEELGRESSEVGVFTAPSIPSGSAPPPEELHTVTAPEVARYLARGKFVLSLGGEHSITLGPVLAMKDAFPGVGILHFDAHGDLRNEYEGTRYGHGCVMRRCLEAGVSITQVGIRSLSAEEAELGRSGKVRTFFMHKTRPFLEHLDDVVKALPKTVYVSIDMDALDPAYAPGVGTPEPGGLEYHEVLALLRGVAKERRIVGADITETRPLPNEVLTEFTAARIAYKIVGYVAESAGWVK